MSIYEVVDGDFTHIYCDGRNLASRYFTKRYTVDSDITDEDLSKLLFEFDIKPFTYYLYNYHTVNPNLHPISASGKPMIYSDGKYSVPKHVIGLYSNGVKEGVDYRGYALVRVPYTVDKTTYDIIGARCLISVYQYEYIRINDDTMQTITYNESSKEMRNVFRRALIRSTKGAHN